MRNLFFTVLAFTLLPATAVGQEQPQPEMNSEEELGRESTPRRYLGTSLWSLYNFSEDGADYYLLTYGHGLTSRDVIIVEANTWKYSEPLGTYGDSAEEYPGWIGAVGIGAGFQRFHWKNLYTTAQATGFLQQFYDEDDEKIQKGFQLYCQLILGYRIEFLDERFYFEPAWALKYWPIDANFPDSFDAIRDGTNNYIFEPSLHIGVNF